MAYEVKPLSQYQRLMERYERFNDAYIFPDSHLVARLDAHRNGNDWASHGNTYPYYSAFAEALKDTAHALQEIGLEVRVSFIHGDEISLIFDPCETANLRKQTRLVSTLASAASVAFLKLTGLEAYFDVRLLELPTEEKIIDYFFWQRQVGHRNYFVRMLELEGVETPHKVVEEGAQLKYLKEIDDDHLYGYLSWGKKEFVNPKTTDKDFYGLIRSVLEITTPQASAPSKITAPRPQTPAPIRAQPPKKDVLTFSTKAKAVSR